MSRRVRQIRCDDGESLKLLLNLSPTAGQFTTIFLLGTGLVALLSQKNRGKPPRLGLVTYRRKTSIKSKKIQTVSYYHRANARCAAERWRDFFALRAGRIHFDRIARKAQKKSRWVAGEARVRSVQLVAACFTGTQLLQKTQIG